MPFRIALSGLAAASTDLKVTGNNIANAGTTGFKESRTEFADVFAVAFGGTASTATGNGVRVSNVAQQFTQGSIEFSDRSLDLAISGQGFFVTKDASGQSYTRAGSFNVDNTGTVVDNNGRSLQIFPVVGGSGSSSSSTQFNTGVLQDLTLATSDGTPAATSTIEAGLNLDASQQPPVNAFDPADASSYNASTSIIVYDSLGTAHTSSLYYVKTATLNQWDSYMYVDGNQVNDSGGGSPTSITFGANGAITAPAVGTPVTYTAVPSATLGTGAAALTLEISYDNTTQFGSAFGVNSLSQDGYASGRLSGIDIDAEGVVFARFTNGQSSALGKVALASFPNQQGMRQLGDTSWSETYESGDLVLGEPGTGSLGLIQSGALEASNVDIAAQLVGLITAQRNFQANAKVISTADTVTQSIINI